MRIDTHAHFAPPSYHETLLQYPVGATIPAWSLEATEEAMGRYEVDLSVLSAAASVYYGDQEEATRLARIVNDAAADIIRDRPLQFAGLASLPLPDVDAALREVEYALDELGLDGVILMSHIGGTYIGEPAFAELWDELDRRGAYVFLHPAVPAWIPHYDYPLWLVELPFETTRAVLSLLYSGTLERCPNTKIQLAHMGGAVPFLAHRIGSFVERDPSQRERVPRDPLSYLRGLFYDTALSINEAALAAALTIVDPGQIVFGTDWPYLPDATISLRQTWTSLTEDELLHIEYRNAAKLFSRASLVGESSAP
jgi:predicted TIM-barrel fold metal-dependent hydrolase